jgi:hypothetical protein
MRPSWKPSGLSCVLVAMSMLFAGTVEAHVPSPYLSCSSQSTGCGVAVSNCGLCYLLIYTCNDIPCVGPGYQTQPISYYSCAQPYTPTLSNCTTPVACSLIRYCGVQYYPTFACTWGPWLTDSTTNDACKGVPP